MRLMQRTLREVNIYEAAGGARERYAWGEGRTIRAAIYPGAAESQRREAGERTEETRVLLCEEPDALRVGMGVCVEAADGRPDYRVARLETWTHARAILQRIPEGKRG